MSEEAGHDQGGRVMPAGVKKGLISVKGGNMYLKAPSRILWMREEHPDWSIETAIVAGGFEEGFVVIKAKISNEQGRVLATAHKEEKTGTFPFISKAETGAIARALAHIGYGTQFGEDEGEGEESVADGPVPGRGAQRLRTGQQDPYAQRRPPNVDANGEIHDGIPSRPPLSRVQQEEWRTEPRQYESSGEARMEIEAAARAAIEAAPTITRAEASRELKKVIQQKCDYVPPTADHYKEFLLHLCDPFKEASEWTAEDFLDAAKLPEDRFVGALVQMRTYMPEAAGASNSAVVDAATMYQSPADKIRDSLKETANGLA